MSCQYPNFEQDQYGAWVALLPDSAPRFFGVPIEVTVSRSDDDDDMGPDPQRLRLLEVIIENLPDAVAKGEAALAEYEKDLEEDFWKHIRHPHVWIPDDQYDPEEWTLVVERDDSPDFGWHIEFRAFEFFDVWAGD